MDKKVFKTLRTRTITLDEDPRRTKKMRINNLSGDYECCICLTQISNLAYLLPCKHKFDFECIDKWIETHDTCPYCREKCFELRYDISGKRFKAKPITSLGANKKTLAASFLGGTNILIVTPPEAEHLNGPIWFWSNEEEATVSIVRRQSNEQGQMVETSLGQLNQSTMYRLNYYTEEIWIRRDENIFNIFAIISTLNEQVRNRNYTEYEQLRDFLVVTGELHS